MDQVRLDGEQTQTLIQAGKDVTMLRALLTKAERAGLNVTELRAKLEAAEKLRNGLLQEFGPQASQ